MTKLSELKSITIALLLASLLAGCQYEENRVYPDAKRSRKMRERIHSANGASADSSHPSEAPLSQSSSSWTTSPVFEASQHSVSAVAPGPLRIEVHCSDVPADRVFADEVVRAAAREIERLSDVRVVHLPNPHMPGASQSADVFGEWDDPRFGGSNYHSLTTTAGPPGGTVLIDLMEHRPYAPMHATLRVSILMPSGGQPVATTVMTRDVPLRKWQDLRGVPRRRELDRQAIPDAADRSPRSLARTLGHDVATWVNRTSLQSGAAVPMFGSGHLSAIDGFYSSVINDPMIHETTINESDWSALPGPPP